MKSLDSQFLEQSLVLLEERLRSLHSSPVTLIICGGTALILSDVVPRTTKDVDVLAFLDSAQNLQDPEPFPESLVDAIAFVANAFNLPKNWLNVGPADIFRMGLPDGFVTRLDIRDIGPVLKVGLISRLDQIFFKLYASVDRGGYHVDDLKRLNPEESEIIAAAKGR